MSDTYPTWYIVKVAAGTCQVVTAAEAESLITTETWGPFASPREAIAKRVGLIRAGKCQPT